MGAGSGRDLNKSEAVEHAWAAALEGSLTAARETELRALYEATGGGASFGTVVSWLRELAGRFPMPVGSASRTSPDINGDVDATLQGGAVAKFEVKAQVKKPVFTAITQSDWVRDQTDLLSRLVDTDPQILNHFNGFGADSLASYSVDPTWTDADLHLADLAGLTSSVARLQMGVATRFDLEAFIDRKWFLHVTQEGARLCRFAELAPIKHLRSGGAHRFEPKVNTTGRAIRSLGPVGETWFTYHLYPPVSNIKGRHKMHTASFEGVSWV